MEKTALELFIDDAFAYGDPMEVPPCGEPRSPVWLSDDLRNLKNHMVDLYVFSLLPHQSTNTKLA